MKLEKVKSLYGYSYKTLELIDLGVIESAKPIYGITPPVIKSRLVGYKLHVVNKFHCISRSMRVTIHHRLFNYRANRYHLWLVITTKGERFYAVGITYKNAVKSLNWNVNKDTICNESTGVASISEA